MGDRRKNDRDRDADNDGDNFFGMAMAGLAGLAGIGAVAYGVSRLLETSNAKRPQTIDVVESEYDCVRAITRIERDIREYPVVGLDCEWQNNWNGTSNNEMVAVLSLCTAKGYCVLLRLREWNSMPSKLETFLNNERILKVGVGIDIDKTKLCTDYELILNGNVDLRFIAKEYGYQTRKLGYLAEEIANITWEDSDHSNWNANPLSKDDIEYAAMDAYASIEIIKKLIPSGQKVMNVCAPFIHRKFTTNMNNF